MSVFECMACYPKLCHCGGTEFRPKGGMCMTCAKRHDDCGDLAFFDMPVISTFEDEGGLTIKVVRCVEHEREASK